MFFITFLGLFLVSFVAGDEPILHLMSTCPLTLAEAPNIAMKADVPAYILAKCANGDREVPTSNGVDFALAGSFDQNYDGPNCRFHKKDGINTFTVKVHIGWGEVDTHVMTKSQIKTLTCAYDKSGEAVAKENLIAQWFLSPGEKQTLKGEEETTIQFNLRMVDVLNRPVNEDSVSIGKKVRLLATDNLDASTAFRALSCVAKNNETEYSILRAGCGDGLVIPRTVGFQTTGGAVSSPYFSAFRLSAGFGVQFDCTFTICVGSCDGDSCVNQLRRKRSSFGLRVKGQTSSINVAL
ncbi:vitelline envelope sperm lysin receptor-like [Liolophura sinensis]|uniref:vitelline envelope sperm lysin receptor-like n=1 Tax=Liolophura sinensis TaxID=3198878 RepID=UPI003158EA3A